MLLTGCANPAKAAPPAELADIYLTTYQDTLLDVARRYDLGYVELVAANPGVDPWLPGADRRIVLPTRHLLPDAPHRGIVVNLADLRLYYYGSGKVSDPVSFPIGTGRQGWETPTGSTRVVAKRPHPAWYPPASIRQAEPDLPAVVPAGPDNPLGDYALYLGWPGYLIHGTNKPFSVGRRVSHGCFHLYPEDISRVFAMIDLGTPVTVVDQIYKLGWIDGALYLEVHLEGAQVDQIEVTDRFTPHPVAGLEAAVRDAAGSEQDRVDWALVRSVGEQRRGIPTRILVSRPAAVAEAGDPSAAAATSASNVSDR